MPISTPSGHNDILPRKPLNGQRNVGSDMSMMFFVRTQCPREFTTPVQNLIKGLNVETIAEVFFPSPAWMTNPKYFTLQAESGNDNSNWGSFSLNLSMYNQALVPYDWEGTWFFMYGRVHPYALTWEVEQGNGLETGDNLQNYTIPALIVRDQGYQRSVHHILLDHTTLLFLTNAAAWPLECSVRQIPFQLPLQ